MASDRVVPKDRNYWLARKLTKELEGLSLSDGGSSRSVVREEGDRDTAPSPSEVRVAALHPHSTCPHCTSITTDALWQWLMKHGAQDWHTTAVRLLEAHTITKKG